VALACLQRIAADAIDGYERKKGFKMENIVDYISAERRRSRPEGIKVQKSILRFISRLSELFIEF
jgi:hypothetical protein